MAMATGSACCERTARPEQSGPVAQLVEQRPYKPCVAGSSPVWPTHHLELPLWTSVADMSEELATCPVTGLRGPRHSAEPVAPFSFSGPVTVGAIVAALEARYPLSLTEPWDSVGLTVGSPDAHVQWVHFVVDVTEETVAEAVALGAEMIVAHHPLLFRPVSSVAASTSRGRIITELITRGIALYVAHTNADNARPGVSDALAEQLGFAAAIPIVPVPTGQLVTGTGRIGDLAEPMTFADFIAHVSRALNTHVRAAGDPAALIRRVAVCGGAGDSLLQQVAATDADVYVTADLRHHVVLDHLAEGGCPVIDAGHWASESAWLKPASQALVADFAGEITATVSPHVTDPWLRS